RFAFGGETTEQSLSALHVNIPGFRIYCRARCRITKVNGVTQVIVIELLPKLLSSFGIKTGHAFLKIGSRPQITHGIKLSIGNHGCRLAGKIGHPQDIVLRDFRWKTGLARNTSLLRPSPTEPALDRCGICAAHK